MNERGVDNRLHTGEIVHIGKEIITIKLKDIVDVAFQRKINDDRVLKIAQNFQMTKYTYPRVAKLEDGKYIVWDGQHRVLALKNKFNEESTIEVFLDNIGYEEAAREFAEQNENSQNVTTVEKFKALVEAKNPTAVEVNNIVTSLGLQIGSGAPVVKINAVKDTVNAYEKLGEQRFTTMLKVMRDGLPQDANMWKAAMIKSMTRFFETYVANNLDIDLLTRVLGNFKYEDEWKTAKSVSPHDTYAGMCYCIARCYNKGTRGSKRLDTKGLIPDKA